MMRRIAQAWGFAAIVLLPNYVDMTSAAGDARMRVALPLTRIALAHLTDTVIVATVFALVLAAFRGMQSWGRIRWVLMGLLPLLLFFRNLNVMPVTIPPLALAAIALAWCAAFLYLILGHPQTAGKLAKFGGNVLAGFAIFGLVMAVQLARAAMWKPGPQAFMHPIAAAPANRPRLVWILFDELSYKYVFETRDPTLQMPNFDRLRSESTLYTDVTPVAYRTTRAVPSLMLGSTVTDVEYTPDNRYLIQTTDAPGWRTFDANASLIGFAQQSGVTTSIIGWYIPYCTLFEHVATQCYWNNDDAQDRGPTLLSASFAQNVWFPLRVMVESFAWPPRAWADESRWASIGHIASVQDVSRHALDVLSTSQADIIYLHIPSPHPVAFWNRRTAQFGMGGSYLDGLDYSDRLLGRMLDILEKQPRWSSTMVIVQGDHSWRTEMWRPLPGWSAEDERISHGGQWDPRPLVMIHAPAEQSPQTIPAPISVTLVHDAVAAEIHAIAQSPAGP
jgi:hypothetical protein